ncbi:MAG: DUF502 domain-containing protein [Chloroflexi bacterium]|nr:DUF502 domain-containing protein [Chloroflexota bacterium]
MRLSVSHSFRDRWKVRVRRTFITGLIILVPLIITYAVLGLAFGAVDGILQPPLKALFGKEVLGAGIVALVLLVFIVGLIGTLHPGQHLIQWVQRELFRLPVVGAVYSASEHLIESFSGSSTTGFKHVVMIEYPRQGTWTIGFLTGVTMGDQERRLALVYIPTAPTPNTGWLAILPVEDVYDTELSVQEALKLTLSGGILAPPQLIRRPLNV